MPFRMTYALSPSARQWRATLALDLFNGTQERELSRKTLDVMLECLFKINVLYLQAHPEAPWLYQSGVTYMEEPPGQEDWQDIPTTLKFGIADCEDLAAWRAAELNVRQGIAAKPVWRSFPRKDGSTLYHILVEYPDGRTEDPSRILGMK